MSDKPTRPAFLTDEHLEYLDHLRESGITNMHGATPWLMAMYPVLSKKEASAVLGYWMETFADRHPDHE